MPAGSVIAAVAGVECFLVELIRKWISPLFHHVLVTAMRGSGLDVSISKPATCSFTTAHHPSQRPVESPWSFKRCTVSKIYDDNTCRQNTASDDIRRYLEKHLYYNTAVVYKLYTAVQSAVHRQSKRNTVRPIFITNTHTHTHTQQQQQIPLFFALCEV